MEVPSAHPARGNHPTGRPPEALREGGAARARELERTLPWAISIALHTAVVIAAFFIVWSTREPEKDEGPPVHVDFDEPAPAPLAVVASDSTPKPISAASEKGAASPLPSPLIASSASAPPDRPAPDTGALALPPISIEPASREALSIESARRPEVNFSGLGASGARDIVYVVDASGSMVTTFPEVLEELRRSIDRLHPAQRFQVLLFRNKAETGFMAPSIPPGLKKPILIDATRRNKDAVFEWLKGVTPGGTSDPRRALEAAVAMKPDAVFLLATRITGPEAQDFAPEALLARLDEINPVNPRTGRRPVAIKAVQILDEDPLGIMRAIGVAHGGEDGYKFISREEFNARRATKPSPGLKKAEGQRK